MILSRVVRPVTSADAIREAASSFSVPVRRATAPAGPAKYARYREPGVIGRPRLSNRAAYCSSSLAMISRASSAFPRSSKISLLVRPWVRSRRCFLWRQARCLQEIDRPPWHWIVYFLQSNHHQTPLQRCVAQPRLLRPVSEAGRNLIGRLAQSPLPRRLAFRRTAILGKLWSPLRLSGQGGLISSARAICFALCTTWGKQSLATAPRKICVARFCIGAANPML